MKKTVRRLATEILNSLSASSSFAHDALDEALEKQGLSGCADGRLLTHLVYGVLRLRGHLDWILAGYCRSDYQAMDEGLKNILRVGLYQLRFSDRLPAFAVVHEAVQVAKHLHPAAAGLVNAVLRNYLRRPDRAPFPDPDRFPVEHISALYAHPAWLVQRLMDDYGYQETLDFCRFVNETPSVTIRVNTLKTSRDALARRLTDLGYRVAPTTYSSDGLHLIESPLPVSKTPLFQEGGLRLQDEAAQLAGRLCAPRPGERILDACAGSGGKTTHLAAMMENSGHITAMDRSREKLAALERESRRLGISIIEPCGADLTFAPEPVYRNAFDRVLVDAPCSGTGTLARNPEIKWRLNKTDLDALAATQDLILKNASATVKKGGLLIYCTCSILPCENDEVIRRFLSDQPHFRFIPAKMSCWAELIDPQGFFRTYPQRHHMDGFFAAILQRAD